MAEIINNDDIRELAIEHASALRQMILLTVQGLIENKIDHRRGQVIAQNAETYIRVTKQQWDMQKEVIEEQIRQVATKKPLLIGQKP